MAYVANATQSAPITVGSDLQATSNIVSSARAAWSVSLVTNKDTFPAGATFSLTATANQNVGSTDGKYRIWIKDKTVGNFIGSCLSGSTCTVSRSFSSGGPHEYLAYVGNATQSAPIVMGTDVQANSNVVTVARAPWTVSLTIDKNVFSAGEQVNLTATADQNVGSTENNYRIWIKDKTLGTFLGSCTSGTSCTKATSFSSGGPHEYVAYVANAAGSYPYSMSTDIQATSNTVTAERATWTVTLSTDRATFQAGQQATLTATANQNVGATDGKYRIWIKDTTLGIFIGSCTTGTTCAFPRSFASGGPHDYIAYVANAAGSYPYSMSTDIQATSNTVTVSRAPWTVSLAITNPIFRAGEATTLTATTDQNVGSTDGKYRIWIKDTTLGIFIGSCTTGTTCSFSRSFTTGGPHDYIAYVADAAGTSPYSMSTDIQASSNTVTAARAPWTVSLAIDNPVFRAGEHFTVTATTNQDVGLTEGNYRIWIKDSTENFFRGSCTSGTSCSFETSFLTGGSHEYVAYVANAAGVFPYSMSTDIQATSNTAWASRAPWTVRLDASTNTVTPGAPVTFTATANQDVGLTGNNYRIALIDYIDGRLIKECPTGTTCAITITAPPEARTYIAHVSRAQTVLPPTDLQAASNGFSAPNAGGPTAAGETAGGSNPSENCSQRCHADPVNSVTGEFFETTTDLAVAGLGAAPAFTRSYAATRAGVDGPLGFGWTHGYAMALGIHPGDRGTTLATATQLDLRQENGALLTFSADGNGNYTAPARVFATLVANGDGTFTFTRRERQVFTFDATGRLVKLADRNANTTALSYNGAGKLISVLDGHERGLTLTWTGERITGVADHTGREISYRYSAGGDLLGVTDARGHERTYTYTPEHLVAAMTDVRGKTTTNTYDTTGRVLTQTDPLGRVTTFAYGNGQTTITDPAGMRRIERHSNGQVTSETIADGTPAEATSSYAYGPTNHVTATTDPLGKVSTAAYDARGNQLSATDPLGRTTTSTYDAAGNLLTVTDPAGATSTYTYDGRGNLLTATDPTGALTRYTINDDGTVATVVGPRGTAAGADPAEHTTRYDYNNVGARISVITATGAKSTATLDALGRTLTTVEARGHEPGADPGDYTSTFTYDLAGNLLTSTTPTGASTSSTYDNAGHRTSVTDPTGRTTSFGYDDAGQLISVTDPAGAVTTYTYDPAGRPRDVTDPLGHTTRTEYTAAGHPWKVTDALGHAATFVHDRNGRLTASTDADGATSTTGYDDAGQVLTLTDPLGAVTHYGYDPAGRRSTVTDADGRLTTTSYDNAGRQTGLTRNDGSTLAWAYNPAGNLTSYTNAAGEITRYGYDADGQRTKTTDPLDRITRYSYDGAGNLTATIAADGTSEETVTTHTYNRAGRLKEIDYPTGTPDVAFGYDNAGRRTSMADGTGTSTYSYDPAGRLAAHTNGTGATVGYAYDTVGRLTAITYPGNHTPARTVSRGYDNADRLTTVTDWNNQTTSFAWTNADRLDAITYPNGVLTDYTRDNAGKATGVRTANGPTVLAETATTYSPAGLVLTDTTAATNPAAAPTSYDYDPLARVNTITTPAGAADFGFTPTHNLSTWADGSTQAYDAADQLTTRTTPADPVAGTPAHTISYAHDARGNRTTATTDPGAPTQSVTSYAYDAANRLTTVNPASGPSTTYTYNGQGLRTGKAVGSTSPQAFVWDVNADLPLLLTDATHDYLYGPAGHPYAQINTTTGETTYLHPDRLGSTRALSDATGARIAAYDYDSYGNPTTSSATGAATTNFRYAGEYTDPDTGLQYLRARYYDPATASFLTRDPIEDTTQLPYSYTAGNPLLFTDPSGLCFGPDVRCKVVDAALEKTGDAAYAALNTDAGRIVSNTLIAVGNGATFGSTATIAEAVSPGAGCYFDNGAGYKALEFATGMFTSYLTGGTLSSWGSAARARTAGMTIDDAGSASMRGPRSGEGLPVRRIYDPYDKHGKVARIDSRGREVSRAPRGDCQAILDCSIPAGPNSPHRVGIEPGTGLRVELRRHLRQEFDDEIVEYFHGFVPGG